MKAWKRYGTVIRRGMGTGNQLTSVCGGGNFYCAGFRILSLLPGAKYMCGCVSVQNKIKEQQQNKNALHRHGFCLFRTPALIASQ